MATMTITIPDAVAPRVLNAFAERFEYNDGLAMTKAEFAKKCVIAYIKSIVVSVESSNAAEAARATSAASAHAIDVT